MKIYLSISFTLFFTFSAFGQTPSAAPSPSNSPEKPTLKNFGSSLKRTDNKAQDKTEDTTKTTTDEETIRVETNLVRIDALVLDQKGNAILGLKQEDFIVSENNVSQNIGTFSLGNSTEVPRSIVLIIDYSGSQIDLIKDSVEAAKVLVDQLNDKDRMAIVTDSVELLSGFSNDKELLKTKLDSLAKKVINGHFEGTTFVNGELGKSLQYNALMATLNELFDNEELRPIVILQTDGDQFFNIRSVTPQPFQPNTNVQADYTVQDLFNKVERSRATIYSIISGFSLVGLSPQERLKKASFVTADLWTTNQFWKPGTADFLNYAERHYQEQKSLDTIAKLSGGFSQNLESSEQAAGIYGNILKGITDRYLIGYYPLNETHDGKRRSVKIEVRGHPEYIVMGRKSYYAQ